MTTLDEALALLSTEDGLLNEIDRHNAEAYVAAVGVIVAAARNWQTLTKQETFSWCVTHEEMGMTHDGEPDCEWVWVALTVFDALTVTAEEERPPKREKRPDPDLWKMEPRP